MKMNRIRIAILGLIGMVLVLAEGGQALADTYATDFDSFALGAVDGQDGWTRNGGAFNYDSAVVSNTYGYLSFGIKSLRISNAIVSGSYNDQTYSRSLINDAGETSAPTGSYSGGVRQPYFEAQWDFASTVPGSEQTGLAVVGSPDRGDGVRMSWVQMQDTPSGLQLNFNDYQLSISNFVMTAIATNLDRTVPYTVKITMHFIDGISNDIVKVYLNGALIHTGTSWEDYHRDQASGGTYPVDCIMFRVGGTAYPANSGKGFVIDNFSSFSGPALAAPSNLTASAQSRTTVLLTWIDNSSNEQGFAVERKVGTNSWIEIARVTANTTSYLDTVANPAGDQIQYRVRAYNADGLSAYSDIFSLTPRVSLPWLILLLGS